ncbi:MAG: TraB/GumN family protein [Desulfatiglandaceae bacterium]
MDRLDNSSAVHRLFFEDKEIVLVGTAHVSIESANLVEQVIDQEHPDTVCVELCSSRYQALTQPDRWKETDLIKVVKEKKAMVLLSNLLLASFQRKIARKLGVRPGEEMLRAIKAAENCGAEIWLADRDIRTTLARTWRNLGLWAKIKLAFNLLMSIPGASDISEEDVEKLKEQDMLESVLAEMARDLPVVKQVLIDERDRYLAFKIRNAPGRKIVAVAGAGHVPGILANWEKPLDITDLEYLPPRGKTFSILKWGIPAGIVALVIAGFLKAGTEAATGMIIWWVIANGVLAGLGAALALAHPVTIISAVAAAPITSINPMIAAGWVAGLVEAMTRKPRVKDFERLTEDIVSIKGFWKNKITRILLVVVFTNLGSSAGTFIAIPLMARILA